MTRILVATSSRHTPVDAPSGHIIVYDLENKKVLKTCEMVEPPYRVENPNPRGGLRGSKGISIQGDLVAISNASTVFVYDKNWKPLHMIYHPSCAGVHDIALDGESVWVTSARNDVLCQLGFDSTLMKYYDNRKMARSLGRKEYMPAIFQTDEQIQSGAIDFRDPRTHDEVFADATHTNGLSMDENGDLLLSLGMLKNQSHQRMLFVKNWMIRNHLWEGFEAFNKFVQKKIIRKANRHSGDLVVQPAKGISAAFKITREGEVKKVLVLEGATSPTHSVRYLKDGSAIWLKTSTGELHHFDHNTGEIFSIEQIGTKFLRGATQLSDGTLILGDNNKLLHYDLKNKKVLFSDLVSPDTMEAIFDFFILPDDFAMPPDSFVKLHEKEMPIDQINDPHQA